MIYKLEDTKAVRYLFEKWDEGVIWGCLEKVMGDIYVDGYFRRFLLFCRKIK